MQVDDAFAINCACHTGRKKLIFSSTVVKDSSGASVLANAIPMAASAISQRIPPWSVPMGFACCGPAANVTEARPSLIALAWKPIRRITGTSFTFARALKSALKGVSGGLMIHPPAFWIPLHEHGFRDTPRDDDMPDPARHLFSAGG